MTCKYRVAKYEERDPVADRVVELEEVSDGVRIRVNGVLVAGLYNTNNYLKLFACHTEKTGLKANEFGYLLAK